MTGYTSDLYVCLPLDDGVALRSAFGWIVQGNPDLMQRYVNSVDPAAIAAGIAACTDLAQALAQRLGES